jgi:hypothetical protein
VNPANIPKRAPKKRVKSQKLFINEEINTNAASIIVVTIIVILYPTYSAISILF